MQYVCGWDAPTHSASIERAVDESKTDKPTKCHVWNTDAKQAHPHTRTHTKANIIAFTKNQQLILKTNANRIHTRNEIIHLMNKQIIIRYTEHFVVMSNVICINILRSVGELSIHVHRLGCSSREFVRIPDVCSSFESIPLFQKMTVTAKFRNTLR